MDNNKTIIDTLHVKERNAGLYSYRDMIIRSLIFDKGVSIIYHRAFKEHGIKSIKFSSTVYEIGSEAFFGNEIAHLRLPNGLVKIGSCAFESNRIKHVNIPSSVESIGSYAFDKNVSITYKGINFSSDLLCKIGYENVIKYQKILESNVISKESLDDFPREVLDEIPLDVDSIKGYDRNKKIYMELVKSLESEDEQKTLSYKRYAFNMCNLLGLFNKPSEEVIEIIKDNIKSLSFEEMERRWEMYNPKENKFIPGFRDLFIKLYKDDKEKLTQSGSDITNFLYNNYHDLKKQTYLRKNSKINKLIMFCKKMKDGPNKKKLLEDIENYKKEAKEITYEDVIYYINSAYKLRNGNEALKKIMPVFSVESYRQEDVDDIQRYYELSKKSKKVVPLLEEEKEGIRYKWLNGSDPLNAILGIVLGCCSRLHGGGEEIMINSMINPNIVNLCIFDENNKIMGKATAYFNLDEHYILFNNIETREIGAWSHKSSEERKCECLNTILRAVNDMVDELKRRNIDISEVRVGMRANDLENTIIKSNIKIYKDSLLRQYEWGEYDGDAGKNQAVLYQKNIKK